MFQLDNPNDLTAVASLPVSGLYLLACGSFATQHTTRKVLVAPKSEMRDMKHNRKRAHAQAHSHALLVLTVRHSCQCAFQWQLLQKNTTKPQAASTGLRHEEQEDPARENRQARVKTPIEVLR